MGGKYSKGSLLFRRRRPYLGDMRPRPLPPLLSTSAILLPLTAAFLGAQQSSATADLDVTVARVMAEQHVVGASVLVAKDGRVLLHKGYGLADLGLDVPTKDETVYHIVGPMLPF